MGTSPAWDVEQPLISLPRGNGSLEKILTPRLGEFSGGFLAGELKVYTAFNIDGQ